MVALAPIFGAPLCVFGAEVWVDEGEWAQDAPAHAEGDEGDIQADISNDRIQLPLCVPNHPNIY